MSLPRFVLPYSGPLAENALVPLDEEQARHLKVLRLQPGDALELLLPGGIWKADLAEAGKRGAAVRLVSALDEHREAAIRIEAWLPLTASLALFDEMLPPTVELGAAVIQPVIYTRSEYDRRKTEARMERWTRIVQASAEQSHRSRLPELRFPVPFEALPKLDCPQRWVAYELRTDERNPVLRREPLAFTHGPEGGITDGEFAALRAAGWQPLSLGASILRAVTCPASILGAVQAQLS